MKYNQNNILQAIFVSSIAILLISCKKEEEVDSHFKATINGVPYYYANPRASLGYLYCGGAVAGNQVSVYADGSNSYANRFGLLWIIIKNYNGPGQYNINSGGSYAYYVIKAGDTAFVNAQLGHGTVDVHHFDKKSGSTTCTDPVTGGTFSCGGGADFGLTFNLDLYNKSNELTTIKDGSYYMSK